MKRISIRHLGYAASALVVLAFPYLALAIFFLVVGLKKFLRKRTQKSVICEIPVEPLSPEARTRPRLRSPRTDRRRLAVDAIKLRVAQQCESSNPQLRLQALDLARHILSIDKRRGARLTPEQIVAHLREEEP